MSTATPAPLLPEHDWLAEAREIARLYEPPHTGRPSALTDIYRVEKVLRLIAQGNYLETACLAAGFNRGTLHDWKQQAKDGNVAAIAFTVAMEKAEALAEADAVSDVAAAGKAGPQFWAASATRLERRHPDRWGKRQDDSSQPRVVVQIGVQSGDVQVAFAPSTTQTERKLTE